MKRGGGKDAGTNKRKYPVWGNSGLEKNPSKKKKVSLEYGFCTQNCLEIDKG